MQNPQTHRVAKTRTLSEDESIYAHITPLAIPVMRTHNIVSAPQQQQAAGPTSPNGPLPSPHNNNGRIPMHANSSQVRMTRSKIGRMHACLCMVLSAHTRLATDSEHHEPCHRATRRCGASGFKTTRPLQEQHCCSQGDKQLEQHPQERVGGTRSQGEVT